MFDSPFSPAPAFPLVAQQTVWSSAMPVLVVGGFIIALGSVSLLMVLWRRKQRRLKTPHDFELLRAPGWSLDEKLEKMDETLLNWYVLGPLAVLLVVMAPVYVHVLYPPANALSLLVSAGLLVVAGCIVQVRKMMAIMDERANLRLGCKGERLVAENLQELVRADGCHVLHDLPAEENGKAFNLDHVVISEKGLAVVETKTRSKPTDVKGVKVIYDGECIAWPRFGNDRKTLTQVRLNAEWLGRLVSRECGITVPVAQVVAIPGWSMDERVCSNPRVVTGRGVADAVRWVLDDQQKTTAGILTPEQLKKIREMLERRCRVAA